MSDHDAAPDPIDKAYVQAEAVLSDDAARTARRARVLATVVHEAATPAAPLSFTLRPAWRRGRWLAAAGVAGLGLILATQVYPPAWRQPPAAPATPKPAASNPKEVAASPAPPPQAIAAPRVEAPVPPRAQNVPPPAPPPPPEPLSVAPAAQAFPAAPAPRPSAPEESASVTAERRLSHPEMADQDTAHAASPAPPAAASGFAARPSDQPARLRAAAAAGRTAEVKALLAEGVPVDDPDADGRTALMKSIEADRPAVAALLRGHGASLDTEDNAGDSARDMAAAKDDAALNKALGLAP
jgi:hypothetical protein